MSHQILTDRQQLRAMKRHFRDLSTTVSLFINAMNVQMGKPSTYERGRVIGMLMNHLDVANDVARRFGLGLPITAKGKPTALLRVEGRP